MAKNITTLLIEAIGKNEEITKLMATEMTKIRAHEDYEACPEDADAELRAEYADVDTDWLAEEIADKINTSRIARHFI